MFSKGDKITMCEHNYLFVQWKGQKSLPAALYMNAFWKEIIDQSAEINQQNQQVTFSFAMQGEQMLQEGTCIIALLMLNIIAEFKWCFEYLMLTI